jgi:pSer/pThr/pTyr-binding forkhead associated (FHA) protein
MPKFLLQLQGAIIKEIPVEKAEYIVGRLPDNDIVIDHPAVSGHHCKITLVGDTFFIEDLNSSNGVFLNAKKTLKSGLKNNDVIGIVKHTLKFIDDPPENHASGVNRVVLENWMRQAEASPGDPRRHKAADGQASRNLH